MLTVSFASTLSVGVQRTATPLATRWIHIFTLAIICSQLPVLALAINLLYARTPNFAEAFGTSWLVAPDALSIPRSEVGPIWTDRGNPDLAYAGFRVECVAYIALWVDSSLAGATTVGIHNLRSVVGANRLGEVDTVAGVGV